MRKLLYSQLAEEELVRLRDDTVRCAVARALVAIEYRQLLPQGYSVQPLTDGWLVITVPVSQGGHPPPLRLQRSEPFNPDDDDNIASHRPVYYIVFRPLTSYDSVRLGFGGHDFFIYSVRDGEELRRRGIDGWY